MLNFSRKCRYGLRAMIDLAAAPAGQNVALSSIARRQDIPAQFLEQVFGAFRRAGLVTGVKGPQGGYRLGKSPREITAAEILNALEGSFHVEAEGRGNRAGAPENASAAAIQDLLIEPVNNALDGVLEALTLDALCKAYQERQADGGDMYYI